MKTPELLAPAGDLERLEYALAYGANAVYLAGSDFGMRAHAGNFSQDGLKTAVDLAHKHGAKVFVTVNAIPRNEDLKKLPDFLAYTQEIGVDALIMADIGVFFMAGAHAPKIERHISTQAGILNHEAAKSWHDMGASRVILARELSLDEIADIRAKAPKGLELEVFVHGAMCVSFSGRCLMSQYLTGRDANQGNCAQPCRWKFHVVEESRPGQYMEIIEDGGTHLFNAQDLNMIEHLPDVLNTGVDSLKIEGRAKSFYYAAVVTGAYRQVLDAIAQGKSPDPLWFQEVKRVSHRHYNTGFFYGPDGAQQHYSDSSYIRGASVVAVVESCDDTGMAKLSQRNRFFVGETLELIAPGQLPISFVCQGLWDKKGEAIEVAPHPMMELSMQLPKTAGKYAILRRVQD